MIQWLFALSGWFVAGVLASKLFHATRDRDDVAVRLMRCTIEHDSLLKDTLYSVQVDSKGVPNTEEIIRRAVAIQKDFPNTELTSEANKGLVLEKLNGLHPVGFTYNDVWTDRTTTGNQFRYVMRHLELFKDLFRFDGPTNKLLLIEGQEQAVSDYLALTEGLLVANDYGSVRWTAEEGSN